MQGSILGPRLFTLYLHQLVTKLPKAAHVVSYADDTYVSILSNSIEDLKIALAHTMLQHDAYLKSIGMVTNANKTELIYFSRSEINETSPLLVGKDTVQPKKTIKILGVLFDQDLSWNSHASKLKHKASLALRKLKFLGKFVKQAGMKKIILTHLFGMLYYGSVVWLNELTSFKIIRSLESIHYKGLRIAAKDYYMTLSRERLDDIFNRATLCKWMKYSNTKMALNMISQSTDGPPPYQPC